MKNFVTSVFVAALPLTIATSTPAFAQTAPTGIAALCVATPEQCTALLLQQIALLKGSFSGAELDAQIAVLVSQVYSAAATATPSSPAAARTLQLELGAAIRTAASEVSDSQVAAGFRQAAAAVTSGRAAEEDPAAYGLQPGSPT